METPTLNTTVIPLSEDQAIHLAELFSALSDASRVKIIAVLLAGPVNVQSLAQAVGISESGVSHHLRGLRQMHLVRFRKQGRHVFYSLDDEHVTTLFRRGMEHVLHS